jgi:peptide chain release factor 2
LSKLLPCFGGIFDWNTAIKTLEALDQQAETSTLWDDPVTAQKILKERDNLKNALGRVSKLKQDLEDAITLIELAEAENDQETEAETEKELDILCVKAQKLQLESLLSGEADSCNAFIEINAGAGGTEAQDWAEMLARMYTRWADSKGYKLEILDENPGEEAGLKSVTIKVNGYQAYGWLKTESGVHRLVRISPYDANARRHTSFASVWIYPEIDDNIDIQIEEKDLRIDTYRASGAGGQHVNKTESAIRITHIPTNIVVQCQSDRSQHRNRAQAYTMLRARLYELELREREAKANANSSSKTEIGWGHQIRSYVLQPYQLVKDNRTGMEKGNTQAVLDGDIDVFLEASLAQRIGEN